MMSGTQFSGPVPLKGSNEDGVLHVGVVVTIILFGSLVSAKKAVISESVNGKEMFAPRGLRPWHG
jgi:hypothetical protein